VSLIRGTRAALRSTDGWAAGGAPLITAGWLAQPTCQMGSAVPRRQRSLRKRLIAQGRAVTAILATADEPFRNASSSDCCGWL